MSVKPKAVIYKLSKTWLDTCISAQVYSCLCSILNASAENAEKVVKPPKKPVITNKLSALSSLVYIKLAIVIPIKKPPIKLAINVPSGKILALSAVFKPSEPKHLLQPHYPPLSIVLLPQGPFVF